MNYPQKIPQKLSPNSIHRNKAAHQRLRNLIQNNHHHRQNKRQKFAFNIFFHENSISEINICVIARNEATRQSTSSLRAQRGNPLFLTDFSLFLRFFPNLLPKKEKFFVNYSIEIFLFPGEILGRKNQNKET